MLFQSMNTSSFIQISLTKLTSKQTFWSSMEGALNRKVVSCKSYFMCKGFFGLGCWPDLHHWPGVDENVVNRNWDADKRRSDQKDSEGKKRRRDQREGSQSRLVRWFPAAGRGFGTSRAKLSSITLSPPPRNPLTSSPEYILSLPVSSEGEIFVESVWLENNVCCSWLPGPCRDKQDCGHSPRDTERSCTYTHIDIFIIHQMPINDGIRGQRGAQT